MDYFPLFDYGQEEPIPLPALQEQSPQVTSLQEPPFQGLSSLTQFPGLSETFDYEFGIGIPLPPLHESPLHEPPQEPAHQGISLPPRRYWFVSNLPPVVRDQEGRLYHMFSQAPVEFVESGIHGIHFEPFESASRVSYFL